MVRNYYVHRLSLGHCRRALRVASTITLLGIWTQASGHVECVLDQGHEHAIQDSSR